MTSLLSIDMSSLSLPLDDIDSTHLDLEACVRQTYVSISSSQPDSVPKAHRKQFKRVLKAHKTAVLKRTKRIEMMGSCVHSPQLSYGTRVLMLDTLRNLPQPEQRSPEWYAQRDRMITASDFGKALKSEKACESFAKEKAKPILDRLECEAKGLEYIRPQRRTGGRACQHGIMFEPVCDLIYRHLCRPGAVTEEFGLLPHPTIEYLGASPDGICNALSSETSMVGRLVEYKAPISRVIQQGLVPEAYMAQMQGQLEVTGLDECDYLECSLRLVEESVAKALVGSEHPPEAYGLIIAYTPSGEDTPAYVYGPYNRIDDEAAFAMLDDSCIPNEADVMYWILDTYQLATLRRNQGWWQTTLGPALASVWSRVIDLSHENKHVLKK